MKNRLKTTARRIVLTGLLSLVMLAFLAPPVPAATKILEIRDINVVFPVGDVFVLPASICGVTGPFSGDFIFNIFHVTEWDNGHVVVQTTNSVRLLDDDGNLILRDRVAAHTVEATGGLPISVKFGNSLVSTCTGKSETPGKLVGFSFGFTVSKDGALVEVHGEVCASYPFC